VPAKDNQKVAAHYCKNMAYSVVLIL
jgi:hypothetical protein